MQLFDIEKFTMKYSMLNMVYLIAFTRYCDKKKFYSDKFFINNFISFVNRCTMILKL